MKIVHVCIAAPYIDGWGYQHNLLPAYLKKAGVDNYVIGSDRVFPAYVKPDVVAAIQAKGSRYEIDGVKIYRIKTKRFTPAIEIIEGLLNTLEEIKPDAIFHHNFNSASLSISARYAKRKGIPLLLDNHADTINMNQHKLWQLFNYKIQIGGTCKIWQKQIYKAYGVTHSRCDFIHDFFGVDRDKIDFLPIGADVDMADTIASKADLRHKYGFGEDDYVIVTGGKMGVGKGTDNLIRAAEELQDNYPHIKLVLFGRFEDSETEEQAKKSPVTSIEGWCDRVKTLELLKLANVACWPIHHTTLIEDAISVRTPIINRKTGTSEHLIDGNGVWIKEGSKEDILGALKTLIQQGEPQREALNAACERMREKISYHTIARKIINDISKHN